MPTYYIPLNPERIFWPKINKDGPVPLHVPGIGPCWEWVGCRNDRGYGKLIFPFEGKKRNVLAHRLSFMLNTGPIPDGLFVLHRCDNPPCVRPGHLFLGTKRDNALDAIAKGRWIVGEAHHSAKFTEGDVREIRRLREQEHIPLHKIARQYGVALIAIQGIVRRTAWKHVD